MSYTEELGRKAKEAEAVIASASTLEKNNTYREILVKNNIITENNEVFLDYTSILDMELDKNKDFSGTQNAVFEPRVG